MRGFPDYDEVLIRFLKQCMGRIEGAYMAVGTSLGVVAAALAKSLDGSTEVIAFEPVHETAKRAAATFALNHLTNVRLFEVAVGDENSTIPFYEALGCNV